MTISIGSRIGSFEITEPLGAGATGEVYRARDTRLERDVAVKVLAPSFTLDAERRVRFEREARVLASLNHSNIATLHGIEESQVGPVLVMELVDGETLADRLALAGPLSVREALTIAEQVAGALAAAHEQGIIHCDLKPANIAVRRDGAAKVLDFGLARAGAASDGNANSLATTVTDWESGVIGAGTPAYMSPEQARGLPVDKRTDIWAFGCVLYECLTGQRPFGGGHPSDVVAKILEREVDFSVLPSDTPAAIRRLLRRCFEKDPSERLRDIGDARLELRDARTPDSPVDTSVSSTRWRWVAVASAVALVLVAATAWKMASVAPLRSSAEPLRMTILLPPGVSVTRAPGLGSSVAVSPDGHTLVIAGTDKDGQRLYRRALDRQEAVPLAGTERGSSPFFSWDGTWVGFLADGRLRRVPAEGGGPVDMAAVPGPLSGVSWGPDDRIVYGYGGDQQLYAVSASGGSPERLSQIAASYPDVLADGREVLLESGGRILVLDRSNGRMTDLEFEGKPVQGTAPRYAAGHLILSRGAALFAVPFDPSRKAVSGTFVSIPDRVASEVSPAGGMRHYALSASGTLAYVPAPSAFELVLLQANGQERVLAVDRAILNPQFSPDGRLVIAARTRGDEPTDIWVHDAEKGTAARLTFDGGRAAVWMPDGRTVTYSHLSQGRGIYAQPADGSAGATRLLAVDAFHWLIGWTPDRRTLAYGVMEGTPSSLMALTDGKSRRVMGPSSLWGGRLSDDGRWLTYYSLDSGNFEVFVTPFPDGGTRWLIGDGTDPTWGSGANEVFYRSGTHLLAARIDGTSGFRVTARRVVLDPFVPPLGDDYDVHPDGRTIVYVRPAASIQPREVTVVVNWFTELRRLESGSRSP
jgi:Tol biopolymer transport system component